MRLALHSLRLAAALMVVAATTVLAQSGDGATIYKWVDEKGVTHYSENPPGRGRAQEIEVPRSPAPAGDQAPAPGKSLQQQEIEFRQRQRERDAAGEKEQIERRVNAVNEKARKQACSEARARIAALQANRRAPMLRRDPATGGTVADFEIRGIEIERLGKLVDENCAPE